MKWVDFIVYELDENFRPKGKVVAQARLDGDTVRFHGPESTIASLRDEPVFCSAEVLGPEHGEVFLRCLAIKYRTPYFVATGMLEGMEPTPIGTEIVPTTTKLR